MLLQYVGLLVPATLNSLRSLCLTSGMLGFVGRYLPVRWVDGCISNRLASSSVVAFICRPICALLTTNCFFGADATYTLMHVLDTAAINLGFCQHTQSLLPVESLLVALRGQAERWVYLAWRNLDRRLLAFRTIVSKHSPECITISRPPRRTPCPAAISERFCSREHL